MAMKNLLCGLLFLMGSSFLFGQQPPVTELFLFDMIQVNDSVWAVHSPTLLTGRQLRGYNNQPFLNGENLYYTQQLQGQSTTDIYRVNIRNEQRVQVTNTKLSEYSPTPTPDQKGISVVRVEEDGSQTLWRYDLFENNHQNLFPEFEEKIGYHSWLNDTLVALFILGEEPTLRVGNIRSKKGYNVYFRHRKMSKN